MKPNTPVTIKEQKPAAAQAQLARFAQSYSTLLEWQSRAAAIRQGILEGAYLTPPPPRGPLNPIIRPARSHPGYTVANVAFESLPGIYVTGSLYRPAQENPSMPAVLCCHPHATSYEEYGRFAPCMQLLGATLARMGAVALACDMVGYGELSITGWKHNARNTFSLQLWNGFRALDWLSEMPGVDPQRIAVAGASGGGTQTIFLTALDPRVAVSIPTVQVSAHFFGGCVCESGMPVHRGPNHETNNAEIAALAAPRPQLIISDGQDWTQNTPAVEFPYIRNVYRLYDAESAVENLHLADEGHDLGPHKRRGIYQFLARHLGLNSDPTPQSETEIPIESRPTLFVFDEKHPLPPNAVRHNNKLVWFLPPKRM